MIKKLHKAIMRRSGLKNIPNKSRTPKTCDSYKKHRAISV